MKVAYFIFSNEYGTGGHHLSLKAINSIVDLIPGVKTKVINIGVAPSPLLVNSEDFKFYKINEFLLPINFLKIFYLCKSERFDILHAFDINGYLFVRIISFLLKIPSIYTKCGGSNNKYNPKAVFGITTSEENYDHLKRRRKHIKLYLVQNRISHFEQNESEIRKIRNDLIKNNEIVFLRIIRISNYYKDSIIKSIKFSSYFSNKVLIFIGSVYDEELKEYISEYASRLHVKLIFMSEQKYTSQARELIGIGDYIFGTGRTAMEVMSTRKTLLGFVKNCEYPIVVNKENFDFFRYYNFSERVIVKSVPSLEDVISFVNEKNNNLETKNFLYKKYEENYLINTKRDYLNELYLEALLYKNRHFYFKDFFVNLYHHLMRCSLIINYVLMVLRRIKNV
jgi:hypothetical protein